MDLRVDAQLTHYYSLESTHRFPHTQNYKGVRKALASIHEDGDLQIAHPELPIWFSSVSLASGAYAEIIPSPVDAENRRKSDYLSSLKEKDSLPGPAKLG